MADLIEDAKALLTRVEGSIASGITLEWKDVVALYDHLHLFAHAAEPAVTEAPTETQFAPEAPAPAAEGVGETEAGA